MIQDVLTLYKKAQNGGLNAQEVFWLEGQAATHPCFGMAYMILARHHFRNQSTIKNKSLLKAAAYANNRSLLRHYLEDTLIQPKVRPIPVAEMRPILEKKTAEVISPTVAEASSKPSEPVENKVQNPAQTEDSIVPVAEIEESIVPVAEIEESIVPVAEIEDSIVPVAEIEESIVPVAEIEDSIVPVAEVEESIVPVAEIEDSIVPVAEVEDSIVPVAEIEDSIVPVAEVENSIVPVAEVEDSIVRLRKSRIRLFRSRRSRIRLFLWRWRQHLSTRRLRLSIGSFTCESNCVWTSSKILAIASERESPILHKPSRKRHWNPIRIQFNRKNQLLTATKKTSY
ncbi:MAG: hypothetical protein IPN95_16750 [Bacteroidetes bacterium]|nr:hypothetical protein [Bacteroidota bacterium]